MKTYRWVFLAGFVGIWSAILLLLQPVLSTILLILIPIAAVIATGMGLEGISIFQGRHFGLIIKREEESEE